jgi:D-beta-D-heptose 7-phosphate kinase / D-beta-D-heptose 1-phosphate adenosyltransferase
MSAPELNLINLLRNRRPHVLVIGDLMLDRYVWGQTDRVSPEAPVPVVDVKSESLGLGGAGNVIANLVAFGASVSICTVVGTEGPARELVRLLDLPGVDPSGLVVERGRRITEKCRLMAGHQQVVRFDAETREPPAAPSAAALMAAITRSLEQETGAIIVSDYGKGVCTEAIIQGVIQRANALRVPVFCDPKGTNYAKYRGATAVTPNRREAAEATRRRIDDDDSLRAAGEALRRELASPYCLVTLSEDGMALFDAGGMTKLPTVAREVFDVTGAGDTVIAGIGFAVAAGVGMYEACRFANVAAGIVVGKLGSASVNFEEMTRHVLGSAAADRLRGKLVDLSELRELLRAHRCLGEQIVFTNGCFDLLHRGHVEYLEAAAKVGDVLVVGLNSDASVKRLKGAGRPIHGAEDRAFVLGGLRSVDYVVIFEEDTPLALIEAVEPEVLVKGGDYQPDAIVGADRVTARGGRVLTIPLVAGRSTSGAIQRIRQAEEYES